MEIELCICHLYRYLIYELQSGGCIMSKVRLYVHEKRPAKEAYVNEKRPI